MKWVVIIGRQRCGTSFLAERIHAAGIPMWLEKPHTVHNECPVMREAWDGMDIGRWKDAAEKRGVFPCGVKHPLLLRRPTLMRQLFDPAETVFILCVRNPFVAKESLRKLTGWTEDECCWQMLTDDAFSREWPEAVVFDYEGNIGAQEKELSERLGVAVDLVNHWRPRV